jgi:hypothetical protein
MLDAAGDLPILRLGAGCSELTIGCQPDLVKCVAGRNATPSRRQQGGRAKAAGPD